MDAAYGFHRRAATEWIGSGKELLPDYRHIRRRCGRPPVCQLVRAGACLVSRSARALDRALYLLVSIRPELHCLRFCAVRLHRRHRRHPGGAAGNAFYTATARVTEISLGIIVTATISRVVLPSLLTDPLWQAVADARERVARYALAVLGHGNAAPLRAKLISQAIAIENLRAAAIFEDREVRDRSNSLRFLNTALIDVVGAAQRLGEQLENLRHAGERVAEAIDDAFAEAADAVEAWRSGRLGAVGLCTAL